MIYLSGLVVEMIYLSLRLWEEVGVRNINMYLKVSEVIHHLWGNCEIGIRFQGLRTRGYLAKTFCYYILRSITFNRASAIFVEVYEPLKRKLLGVFPDHLSSVAHLVRNWHCFVLGFCISSSYVTKLLNFLFLSRGPHMELASVFPHSILWMMSL